MPDDIEELTNPPEYRWGPMVSFLWQSDHVGHPSSHCKHGTCIGLDPKGARNVAEVTVPSLQQSWKWTTPSW